MKLLTPRDLNTKLQDQKKTEINAGLFLAKKVDKLREDVQEEQKRYDDLVATLAQSYFEIQRDLEIKRDSLQKEIKTAELKLIELRKPLDEEWAKVKEETRVNEQFKESLDRADTILIKKDAELVSKSDELQKREDWIKDNETRTSQLLKRAKEDYQEAKDILMNAKENETEIKESLKVRTKAVEKRETDIAYREVDADNKWKNALAKEAANRKETLHIESKQRQLSTAFAELEKRNGTAHNTNG